jgi:hypothetical protein
MDEEMRHRVEAVLQRPVYATLDPQIMAAIDDEQLERAVIDFVLEHAKARELDEAEALDELDPAFSHVYATWMTEAEVFNGGFNQYFFNSSGRLGRADCRLTRPLQRDVSVSQDGSRCGDLSPVTQPVGAWTTEAPSTALP